MNKTKLILLRAAISLGSRRVRVFRQRYCAQQKPGSRSSPIRNGFYIGGERDGQTCTEGTGV
jgi:hypothetical protein